MNSERDQLVRHWVERAREAIGEAALLAEHRHWNTCVSRLYYACFYAATGLLLRQNLSASRHSAVLSLFNREFVKTGKIATDEARIYGELFAARHEADYSALAGFAEQEIQRWTERAVRLVDRIEQLVSDGSVESPEA